MGQCVATIKGNEKCEKETPKGYRYCDEHKTRPKAVEERETTGLNTVIDASEAFTPSFVGQEQTTSTDVEQAKTDKLPSRQKNIYEKTADVLERALEWEEQTWTKVQSLRPDEWYTEDKTGIFQPNPLIGMNERGQDRTIRAVTAIAKLNIDAQSVNINKMVQEVVKSVVTKSLTRAGFEPPQIEQVRMYMAEEFERVAQEAG